MRRKWNTRYSNNLEEGAGDPDSWSEEGAGDPDSWSEEGAGDPDSWSEGDRFPDYELEGKVIVLHRIGSWYQKITKEQILTIIGEQVPDIKEVLFLTSRG